MRTLIAAILMAFGAAHEAHAATTVYATSVTAQSGIVNNAAGGVGPADSSAATIGRFFNLGFITFSQAGQVEYFFAQALSGAGLQLSALGGFGAPRVAISIGEIVGGVATYSAETAFIGGPAGLYSFDLSAQCSAISVAGCSLLRIRTIGGFGGGAFNLDGISGVAAAPEPSIWAMTFVGFAALSWRLKQSRRLARACTV